MRMLSRWSPERHKYEPYGIPPEWIVTNYETDMDAHINCAACEALVTYGETYTSLQIHALPSGFGYAVCAICHEAEVKRELRARESEEDAA